MVRGLFYTYQIEKLSLMERSHSPLCTRPTENEEMIRLFDSTNRFIKYLMIGACLQYLLGMALLGLI